MSRLTAFIGCIGALGFLLCIGAARHTQHSDAPQTQTPTPSVATSTAAPTNAGNSTHWYIITLNNVPTGWTRLQTKTIPEGFRTETQTRLRMAREKQILSMTSTSWIEEDAAGRPLRGGQTQAGGGMSVRVAWEFVADGIRERRTQGATVKERILPAIDKEALAPMAAMRMGQGARAAGKSDFTLLIIDPSQGLQTQLNRWEKIDDSAAVIAGKSVACTRWRTSGPMIAKGSEEWINAAGETVLSQTPTGLGVLKNVMCDESTALAALDEAKPPVEVMVASFVKVDHALSQVSTKRALTLLVKAKKPPIMPPPQEGFQRVAHNPDGSFTVTIDLDRPADPSLASVATDAVFMESSPMIDWNDPAVIALKDKAVEQWKSQLKSKNKATILDKKNPDFAANTLQKAKVFRSVVANHITNQNLGSAFASASETAQNKSGDCTEYAVLLAALLRADGIPSRVAAGLVWAEYFAGEKNVFAWHLWTQAFIDGRWIDLDATLPAGEESFHVGHVLLAVTPLTDAASDPAWSSLLTSMGNLSIEVSDGPNQ